VGVVGVSDDTYCADVIEQAVENSEPLVETGKQLANSAVAAVASGTGRTPDEQWERIGDRFAYESAEMDPDQKQLDDYEISGDRREVPR